MKKLIEKFIVWYLKRNNAKFEYENYIVRVFLKGYYTHLMFFANSMNHPNCRCSFIPVFNDTSEKGGAE